MPVYILLLASLSFIACSGDEGGYVLKKVPRNRTLIMDCAEANSCSGQIQDYNSFNPFIPGSISRIGFNFLYEPLYFFNAYEENSELIPWIAESHRFNEDYTELVVKIRPGVEWSDGHPWSAHDFVFTINMLVEHTPQLVYSTDMATWVEEAVALDSLTARVTLKAPNPRFLFSYFVHSGDQGCPIVPKHIWEDKDPLTFANFDLQKGWPVLTGPYRIARSEPAQRIWDLREGWWAEKLGFQELPQVERLIYLTYMEEHKRVQNLIANNIDTCLELRPANMVSLLERNRNITTWTAASRRTATSLGGPYRWGSMGWRPLVRPGDAPRGQLRHRPRTTRGHRLAKLRCMDPAALARPPADAAVFCPLRGLVAKHQVGVFDLEKSAEILARKGYIRNGVFWEKDGQPLSMVIDIFSHFQDLTPVLIAQLKRPASTPLSA